MSERFPELQAMASGPTWSSATRCAHSTSASVDIEIEGRVASSSVDAEAHCTRWSRVLSIAVAFRCRGTHSRLDARDEPIRDAADDPALECVTGIPLREVDLRSDAERQIDAGPGTLFDEAALAVDCIGGNCFT